MTDQETLLRAAQEAPDDIALRLVHADLLEDRGDPRAEMVRVRCALAALGRADPRRQRRSPPGSAATSNSRSLTQFAMPKVTRKRSPSTSSRVTAGTCGQLSLVPTSTCSRGSPALAIR
jgi:uncharacterized protein (TIGR02996 family)